MYAHLFKEPSKEDVDLIMGDYDILKDMMIVINDSNGILLKLMLLSNERHVGLLIDEVIKNSFTIDSHIEECIIALLEERSNYSTDLLNRFKNHCQTIRKRNTFQDDFFDDW